MTEYMKKMLSVMEYGVPYTSKAIMDKLGLKSKETFRKSSYGQRSAWPNVGIIQICL